MSKSPYIYVFLKDESGTPISLIPLLSQTPLKQNFKTISDKIKLPKNKLIELRVQGSALNETKSLQDQNVKPYSDIQIIIKDEFSIKEIKEPHYSKPTPLNQENNPITIPNFTNRNIVEAANIPNLIEESMAAPLGYGEKYKQNIIEKQKNDEKDELILKKIIKIQRFIRNKKSMKLYKIKQKKLKHRKYVIEEIITSEEKYMLSLFSIQNNVILPCREKKILFKNDEDNVFSNLESLSLFSQKLHVSLKEVFGNNFSRNQTKIAEVLLKMMPFFKLYIPYLNNYENSIKYLENLRKSNQKFSSFLAEIEYTAPLQNMDLSSMLIKPIQRLPKYVLLFKDLKKNTEECHPDYKNIAECLDKFETINTEYNSQMKEYLKKMKIFELQQKFGSESLLILEPSREFIAEEAISIIIREFPKQSICFFLTDMLLVCDRMFENWKLLKFIHLDAYSYIRDLPDTKYFKHIFTVYGKEEGLNFSTDSFENKLKLMEMIEDLIKKLKIKSESKMKGLKQYQKGKTEEIIKKMQSTPVIIQVLGTIKRGLRKFNPYTVYIIEIRMEKICQRVFLRYSELIKLDEIIKKDFSTIKVTHFPPKKLIGDNKTKTIESRKLLIEAFLQSVLKNESIIEGGYKILAFLGLPLNFYDLKEFTNEPRKIMLTMKDNMIHQQLLDTVSIYKILFEEGKKVQRISSYHYSSQFEQDEINNITRDIEISLMNGEKMSLSINKTTKAYDLCKEIASNKNITSWLDYKLFLINSEKDERLIHDDEFVYKIVESEMAEMLEQNVDYLVEVEFPKEDITLGMKPKSKSFVSSPQKKSFLSGMKDKMKDLYNNVRRKTKNIFGSEYIIVFKKYIYLYDNIEAVDYSLDVNKLNLLSEQILNEVYKLNYVLSFNDYAFFAALQFFLKKGKITLIQTTDFLHLMEENSLKEYVPKEVFEKKPKDFWINAVGSLWKKFSEEFEKTSLQNQLFNENNSSAVLKSLQVKKKPNLAILDKKPIDENLIARYVCINCIKKTPLYGNSCFWVGIENKPEGEKYPNSTWIAINCKNIRILDDRKGELKRIEYPSINKCNSFPTSVEIILESIKKDENNKNNEQIVKKYRFDAPNSFDIYQLIELYRYLGVVIKSNRSKYIEVVKNGDVVLKSKFMH